MSLPTRSKLAPLLLGLALLAAPAVADEHYAPKVTLDLETRDWSAPHFADSPLVGRIFDGTGNPSDESHLLAAVFRSHFVLLGEVHPHVDHHALQARVLKEIAVAGRRPSVVLEMAPRGLQAVLDEAEAIGADTLGRALAWEKRGWPDWEIYKPIFEVALAYGLPLVAGDLEGPRIRALARGTEVSDDASLGLDEALPEPLQASLLETLFQSHCELMPREALGGMALAQRARDGSLTRALVDTATPDGAVLIAGAGHLDRELGVPRLLDHWVPEKSRVAVAFSEVRDADQSADSLAAEGFDFLVMTPRAEVKDHCAELREQFSGHSQ